MITDVIIWLITTLTIMAATTQNKFISINAPAYEWAAKMFTFALLWFSPLAWKIAIITVFIGLDTIMGIVAAYKMGEQISSSKLRKGFIPKAIGYSVMVTGCYFIDNAIFDVHATYLAVMFVAFAEMKSMDENLKKITGFSLWDKITKSIDKNKQ